MANNNRYMFFNNLKQMRRNVDEILKMDEQLVFGTLENGHDWAQDHISTSKDDVEEVYHFLKNEFEGDNSLFLEEKIKQILRSSIVVSNNDTIDEGKKKTGTKLCARGKSAAKSKFDVYPSAYANGYAVQVCKGTMPGLDGKKRCSGAYC